MRRSYSSPTLPTNRGSVLLVVMGTVVLLGVALASVLGLLMHEQRMLARTSAWNAALPVAEAGIEEAMSHLCQVNRGNRATNGWVALGSSFVKTNLSALDQSRFVVGVSSGEDPVVLCQGYVWCPSGNCYIGRRVQVRTKWSPVWEGLIAKTKAEVQGTARADSYDSSNPLYSGPNGIYDPTKYRDETLVGCMQGDVLVKDSAKVYGDVGTDLGFISVTPPAKVGDKAFVNGGGGGLQFGHSTYDLNADFPVIAPPTGLLWNNSIPANQVLSNANYKVNSYTSGGTLRVMGNVILYCTSEFHPTGGQVIIEPGGKLTLYFGSQFYAENGIQINTNGTPDQFTVFGVGSDAKEVYIQGLGTKVTGRFCAPAAKMYIQDNSQLSGAGLCNELVLQGSAQFHYDESLSTRGQPYQIIFWTEL